MERNNLIKKGVVGAFIFLFISVSNIPSTGILEKDYNLTDNELFSIPFNEDKILMGDPTSAHIIVYSAHLDWPPMSRIYLLHMDGSIITYYEYSNVRLLDFEVVNNEIYVTEALCPLVYKIDLNTGNLEQIIFDLSLYYIYDLAFDGTYFYCDEWDLNRYDINGNKQGTASFNESVLGSAWDGTYYWTLDDSNQIKCWDLSNWPTINGVPGNTFIPPTPSCHGLWFDGQYFWTAESIDGSIGNIYQFDYSGAIIDQWLEPNFTGWSACIVGINDTTPPVTTCTLNPPAPNGDNGWYVSDVEVTLNATDDMSGLNRTEYRIQGGSIKIYMEPFNVSQDGELMVEYRSIDYAGNVEDWKSVEFKIDQTKPCIDLTWEADKEDGIWYITFTATCSDATSGMDRVEFYIDDELIYTDVAEPFVWIYTVPFVSQVIGLIFNPQFSEENVTFFALIVIITNEHNSSSVYSKHFYAIAYDMAGNSETDTIIGISYNPPGVYMFQRLTFPNNYKGYIGKFLIRAIFDYE